MGIISLLRRGLKVAAFVYAVTFFGVTVFAATFENPVATPQADVIVCLSAGVSARGQIDDASTKRAIACAALFTTGVAPKVLFTGGNDAPGGQSASRGMAVLAQNNGVTANAVLLEENSHSTLQNALFSRPFVADTDRIVIVTEGFHLPRSKASFAAMGMTDSVLWMSEPLRRNADGSIRWSMIHRETLAVWFNLGRYAIWKAAEILGADDVDHWLT